MVAEQTRGRFGGQVIHHCSLCIEGPSLDFPLCCSSTARLWPSTAPSCMRQSWIYMLRTASRERRLVLAGFALDHICQDLLQAPSSCFSSNDDRPDIRQMLGSHMTSPALWGLARAKLPQAGPEAQPHKQMPPIGPETASSQTDHSGWVCLSPRSAARQLKQGSSAVVQILSWPSSKCCAAAGHAHRRRAHAPEAEASLGGLCQPGFLQATHALWYRPPHPPLAWPCVSLCLSAVPAVQVLLPVHAGHAGGV